MSQVCEGCGLPLIWAHTPTGARAPIVRDSSDDGNVLLLRHTQLGVIAVQLTKDMLEEARRQGVELRRNHFADCPNRAQFARKQKARA
jgi:hypothetical protein